MTRNMKIFIAVAVVSVLLIIGGVMIINRSGSCREEASRAAEEFRNEYVSDGVGGELYLEEMADVIEEEAYQACLRGD